MFWIRASWLKKDITPIRKTGIGYLIIPTFREKSMKNEFIFTLLYN